MIKIKMDDVFAIEADYEKMHISLLNSRRGPIHVIKCFSYFHLLDLHTQLVKSFEKALDGKNILIVLPMDHGIQTTKKSYKGGSLYMDFSTREKL